MMRIPELYHVLLVEDDEVDRMAFERFVQRENLPYNYTIASSIAEAQKVLAIQNFDVALMDYLLGDGISLDLFDSMRNIPIVVITGSGDLKIAVEVMKSGAYDYLTKDPDGNYLTALPITVKNTIERWQAQQELTLYRNHLEKVVEERTAAWLEGEQRLHAIVESTPTIVFSLDPEGKFTFLVGKSQDILGYSPNELLGQSLFGVFPEMLPFQTQVLSGGSFTTDIKLDGHWLYMNVSAKQAHGESGAGITGVIHDISQRKQAELAVIQERNLLRTLIDNIPDYIFIKDRDGRFIETNRAHAAGANHTREGIINRTALEVFDPTVAQQFHADDLYVMSSGNSIINQERTTTNQDGSKRWVLTTKVPLYDEIGKNVIGLVGISRDISDRRKVEEVRLQAQRLRMEVEQEREVVDMKQRFIATASHNFRTPLSIVLMCVNTLESYHDRLSHEQRLEKLQQIKSQIDHMVRLLEDVLTLSKTSSGNMRLSVSMVDVSLFCRRIWDDMVRLDQEKHQYHFDFLASTNQMPADEHLLQQILVNLLSNSFKYTPQGGNIHFQITSDDQYVTFCITDTGYGIPKADRKHLFEPFYRAKNVKNTQGTGLGLTIIKTYVELHDGTIDVKSKEGVGTTFTVQMPRHLSKA